MIKKFLIAFAIAITAVSSSFGFYSESVSAANNDYGIKPDCHYLLGFTSWNCGVVINDQGTLKTGVWQIAANVLTDLTVAAAYLVLGYVIYGGYIYISSSGDPNKVAKGKKTLTQAFIGLAIVMSASIIMSSIRIALVGSSGNIGNCASQAGCVNPNEMIENLIHWVIGISGIIAVIFVVYGGISYTISAGDPSKIKQAKNMILYAVIGLVIVALAEVITAFVSNTIRKSSAYIQTNETIISKEVTYENKID